MGHFFISMLVANKREQTPTR